MVHPSILVENFNCILEASLETMSSSIPIRDKMSKTHGIEERRLAVFHNYVSCLACLIE